MRRRFPILLVLALAAAVTSSAWAQPAPGQPSAAASVPPAAASPAPSRPLRFGLPPPGPLPSPAPSPTPAPLPDPGTPAPPAPLAPLAPSAPSAVEPARAGDEPVVLIDLVDAPKEIYIGQPFFVELTVTTRPGVHVNLPAKIDPGPRFTLEGEPVEGTTVTFDSGNLMRKYRLKLVSWTTDRLLNRRADRVRDRLQRHEQDLAEQKTKLTEARLANQDTRALEERITQYQARVDADAAELAEIEAEVELKPIPVTFRRADGSLGVVPSHEPGRGPRILISSRLANEPDPKLKEPASEENVKAGGPFWEPWDLYEENTTLKNVLLGVLIGLLVMALLVPLVLWLRKKWRRAPPPAPPRPAHLIAFERLEALRARGIPAETEENQRFAFELSEILREYFGNRYHFYSLEMTTTELLARLSELAPAGVGPAELEDFFEFLDLVKFAKAPLEPAEAGARLETGVDFVRRTLLVQLGPAVGEEPAGVEEKTGSEKETGADGDGAAPSEARPPRDPWEPPPGESLDEQHRRLLLASTREQVGSGKDPDESGSNPAKGKTDSGEVPPGGNHETP